MSYPAHNCGLYALKPSYGRISRFGVVLYSSSNDTVGIFGREIKDVETVFSKLK